MSIARIEGFKGQYRFLSNFWLCNIMLDGLWFPSVENAYQAAKSYDKEYRLGLTELTASNARAAGRLVKLRGDWEVVKQEVMYFLLVQKFRQPTLRQALLDTGDAYLEETNFHGDTYWGVCRGVGTNHLGILLMQIRDEIRKQAERNSV